MLNYWNATWSLDEKQCPCDIHFVDYLEQAGTENAAIFHMGTGSHHIVGLKMAAGGKGNHVLAVTASPDEYEAYVRLAIENPRLGFTYKAYFGDIYQIDAKLLPSLDHVTLFHLGEYRTEANDSYGALTDLEMARVLVSRLRPGGELHLYTGSFAYDKADAVAGRLVAEGALAEAGSFATLRRLTKR
jgi:hypothetical protein